MAMDCPRTAEQKVEDLLKDTRMFQQAIFDYLKDHLRLDINRTTYGNYEVKMFLTSPTGEEVRLHDWNNTIMLND